MIQENFLPRLFFRKTKTLSPIVGTLSTVLIKMARLGLLNPVTLEKEKFPSSQKGSVELIRAMTGEGELSNADNLQTLRGEKRDRQKDRESTNKTKLKGLV